MGDPYVVTLAVGDDVQARWAAERERWFPPGRTQVGAHVTLFHAIPGSIDPRPALTSATDRPPFAVTVADVVPLGRGVAYRLESAELAQVHASLRASWAEHLTPQDGQGFRPHVTVQNKVEAEVARQTRETLAAGFTAYEVAAVGVDLWRYEGGPWSHVERHPFGPLG